MVIVEEVGRVRLVLKERVRAKVLLAGFHGVGQVGWIATRYIADKLEARKIGFVLTADMPAFVTVKGGIVAPYELYSVGDFLLFVTNVPMSQRDLSRVPLTIADFALRAGLEEAVLFGGLDRRFVAEGDDAVRIAPTRSYLEKHPESVQGLKVIEESLGIVGPLAVMLAAYEAYDSPACAILPLASPERPDPLAASRAIEVANKLLGLSVDVQELREEAALLEKRVEEIQKKLSEIMREREPPAYHV